MLRATRPNERIRLTFILSREHVRTTITNRLEKFMKQKLLSVLIGLAVVPTAFSRSAPLYENWGIVLCPPEIPPIVDASNFVNHAQFTINYTNLGGLLQESIFEPRNMLNFTNDFGAEMSFNSGLLLDNKSAQQVRRARTVVNNGTINCGTVGTSNVYVINDIWFEFIGSLAGAHCEVNATNVVSPGTFNMGFDSLLSIAGENVDFTHGTLSMDRVGFFNTFNQLGFAIFGGGILAGYWGMSFENTNFDFRVNPAIFEATPPSSQTFFVTNRAYATFFNSMGGPSYVPYLLDVTSADLTNRTVRAIFLSNTNSQIATKVYFYSFDAYQLGPDIIEWSWVYTNALGITTNYMYLQDDYLEFTNHFLLFDGYAGLGFSRPTYIPENYTFYLGSQLALGIPAATPTAIPSGTFIPGLVTNQWTAFEGLFVPGTVVPGDSAGQNVTNFPGRIEVTADKCLSLAQAQISSANYLLLKATNQFAGSPGAVIESPYSDLYLRSTNGVLNLTNVLAPELQRPIGACDLYSARWTNVVSGVTNRFHVLFVDTRLQRTSPLLVQTLNLSVTNGLTHANDDSIFIRDVFNVTSNLLISTRRLTITTNDVGSPTPAGMVNYLNPAILWPAATPRLQYFTNNGGFVAPNLVVFGGSQSSPYSSPNSSANPYAAFVNTGGVTNFASAIFATNFQNSGTFQANGGAIQLYQARTVILTNGAFLAPGPAGQINIYGNSLLVSNHVLLAGNAIRLTLTNYLDDGSVTVGPDAVTNRNIWRADGINLPVLPTTSSLLATTITNLDTNGAVVLDTWAGQDRGAVPSGFNNNAAIGRLILDGMTNRTQFSFLPATTNNALYVDYLEFRDYMTNFDRSGNLANLNIAPGIKIYYAQLIINGVSLAEKLNGKNGGGLNWVSGYAGTFSSTNMVYPDGTTNRLNAALVQSCEIDSNGNGIPNCTDPAPVPVASVMGLTASLAQKTNVVLSWTGVPFMRNYLEYKTSLKATTWQPLTNFFVPGPGSSQLNVIEPAGASSRCYRVRIAP
jgi:hypothetical protein